MNKIALEKILFFAFATLVILSAGLGADGSQYLKWHNFFLDYEISIFSSLPKSFTGAPIVTWSYGPGLLAAIFYKIFSFLPLTADYLVPGLIGLLSLICIIQIAKNYGYGDPEILVIIYAFHLLTPAGYYFNKFSTEGWTICATLWSIFFMDKYFITRGKGDILLLSLALYFLILIKIPNIILCFAILSILLLKIAKNFHKKNLLDSFLVFFIAIVGPLTALIFTGQFNRLMMGGYFSSPYAVGDDLFRLFSFSHLYIYETLFSSWHGLFFYHPFILLFIGLVFYLWRGVKSQILFAVIFTTFLLQVLIQSSWFTWWMGTNTFGGRAYSGVCVLFFYYAVIFFKEERSRLSCLAFPGLLILLTYQCFITSLGVSNILDWGMSAPLNVTNIFSRHNLKILSLIVFLNSITFYFLRKKMTEKLIIFYILMIFNSFLSYLLSIKYSNIGITHFFLAIIFSFLLLDKSLIIKKIMIRNYVSIVLIFFAASIYMQLRLYSTFSEVRRVDDLNIKPLDCDEWSEAYRELSLLKGYKKDLYQYKLFLLRSGCAID